MSSIIDRAKLAYSVMTGKAVSADGAKAEGWNWRGGTKPGYLFDGSKFRGGMMYPSAFDLDFEALRNKSRMSYWESPQARAIINRLTDNVIGTGLALEHTPIWKLTGDQGMDEKAKHEYSRDVEQGFDLFMKSHELDATGRLTGYEIQAYEFMNRLRDGETVGVIRYSGDANRISPVSVQFILPEQVVTPGSAEAVNAAKAAGHKIVDGIEVDNAGRELAIHVAEIDDYGNVLANKTTRIPVSGQSGRRFVLHPLVADIMGAVRGSPLLGPMIHELQKITDGTVAELEAMVINAVLAVWIEPSAEASSSKALAGITRGNTASNTESRREESGTATATFDKPGLIVQTLKAGEKINSFDTKRPNVNFPEFVKQITKVLCASVGVPIEILEESFNANYSASRASLLLFWNTVERWRDTCASQFMNPIFDAWFSEEVKLGRIKAPNFSDTPIIRASWLSCSWNGDKQPSIDPLKEANADDVRIAQGTTTRERVAMEYNGSDAMENILRLKIENEALAEANGPMQKASASVQAIPEEKDNEEEKNSEGEK